MGGRERNFLVLRPESYTVSNQGMALPEMGSEQRFLLCAESESKATNVFSCIGKGWPTIQATL